LATDGRLVAEGAPADQATVTLEGVHSALVVDLGDARPVGALLLQAGAADVYFVEAATSPSRWQVVWRVPPLPVGDGQRTRMTRLPRPVLARWLRVRPTTFRSPAVAEIQAFAAEPRVWPALDLSRPDSRLPLWPRLTRERVGELYGILATALMLAAGWHALSLRLGRPGPALLRRCVLVAVAATSLLAWPNFFNFHYYQVVHVWEVFHYYMGAKYLPELGYTRLYTCAAAVDAEDGIDLHTRLMRDLRDNRIVPAEVELQRSGECHARFSPQRWSAFQHDARFFRDAMGPEGWTGARNDHGFNGTPAWALLGGLLASLAPASWPQIIALTLLDGALLLGMLLVIDRGFGLEAACIAAGYWGLNALSPFGWTGGAFLRNDWLFWLLAGVAALRLRRPAVAGFALAYSTLLRIFPVCVLAGLGLKLLGDALEERSLRPLWRQGRLAAGATLAAVLFVGGPALVTGRASIWTEFAENSAKHLATETVNLVGLPTFLAYQPETRLELMTDPLLLDPYAAWKEGLSAAGRDNRLVEWLATGAFALLLLLASRQNPDWVAAVLGLGLMPVMLTLSSYYYSGFMAFATLWSVHPAFGFVLASFAWATNVIMALCSGADEQYAWLSLATVVLVTGVTGALAWPRKTPAGA
jgi:hypothetical protein